MTDQANQQTSPYFFVTFMAGSIFLTLLLLGAMFWGSFGFVLGLIETTEKLLFLEIQLQYYAGVAGITTGFTAIILLLYSLRVTKPLVEALRAVGRGNASSPVHVRNWLYHQFKWRLIGLVALGFMVTFLLMVGLYVATILLFVQLGDPNWIELQAVLRALKFYGGITLASVLLALIMIVLFGLRLIQDQLNMKEVDSLSGSEQPSFFEWIKILFNYDVNRLPLQLKQKQLLNELKSKDITGSYE